MRLRRINTNDPIGVVVHMTDGNAGKQIKRWDILIFTQKRLLHHDNKIFFFLNRDKSEVYQMTYSLNAQPDVSKSK